MSEPDDSDMQAAEYVLGTLDADERASVVARLSGDADLARRVAAWEGRLGPLAETVPEIPPPAAVYAAIESRLFGRGGRSGAPSDGTALLRRVRRWQAATAGFALLAASLLATVAVREIARPPAPQRFTAVLQRDAAAPAIVVDVDLRAKRLTVLPITAKVPVGRSFELWIIDPALGAPRSLGVLPTGAATFDSLTAYDPAVIAGATYAVTVEPVGGSPTGRPSAAPFLTGRLSPGSS